MEIQKFCGRIEANVLQMTRSQLAVDKSLILIFARIAKLLLTFIYKMEWMKIGNFKAGWHFLLLNIAECQVQVNGVKLCECVWRNFKQDR